jgi:hypothetical protein
MVLHTLEWFLPFFPVNRLNSIRTTDSLGMLSIWLEYDTRGPRQGDSHDKSPIWMRGRPRAGMIAQPTSGSLAAIILRGAWPDRGTFVRSLGERFSTIVRLTRNDSVANTGAKGVAVAKDFDRRHEVGFSVHSGSGFA